MEIKVVNQPLLQGSKAQNNNASRPIQKAITQTFKSTAQLANLLPTGTVLALEFLSPIFTNQGQCGPTSRLLTQSLIALCGISCFLLSFTDTFRDAEGNVCHGIATCKGLWVIDGAAEGPALPPETAAKYRIRFIDFIHGFVSMLVFGAVALFNQDVVMCLYPEPSEETKQVLVGLPVGIGVICSMIFVAFPTTRHGIGFPLSAQ